MQRNSAGFPELPLPPLVAEQTDGLPALPPPALIRVPLEGLVRTSVPAPLPAARLLPRLQIASVDVRPSAGGQRWTFRYTDGTTMETCDGSYAELLSREMFTTKPPNNK